jgi:hypothetical protein
VEGAFCGANVTTPGGTGLCPVKYYCPRGSPLPLPAPPGHYVKKAGTIYPEKCRPGTYAPTWLMEQCLSCPAGYQCAIDGAVVPEICPAGKYRVETTEDMDPEDNVFCRPCPQGTWSNVLGLTDGNMCMPCEERYVCPMEGMTRFAPHTDTQCDDDRDGVVEENEVCYRNTQGYDCPEGYACDVATTYFTQKDYQCEAGYWCKVRTRPDEMRNLLCPEGHYCRVATGESSKTTFNCPSNWFCPNGTAWSGKTTGGTVSLDLLAVQAQYDMMNTGSPMGAMCRNCTTRSPCRGTAGTSTSGRGRAASSTASLVARTTRS